MLPSNVQSREQRRYKIIQVPDHMVLNCFVTSTDGPECLTMNRITIPGLPENARVVFANWSNYRGCFELVVYHESFPELPAGEEIPVLQKEYKSIKIQKFRIFDDVVRTGAHHSGRYGSYIGTHQRSKRYLNDIDGYSETELMEYYGILGWDSKWCAVFKPEWAPQSGTYLRRGAEHIWNALNSIPVTTEEIRRRAEDVMNWETVGFPDNPNPYQHDGTMTYYLNDKKIGETRIFVPNGTKLRDGTKVYNPDPDKTTVQVETARIAEFYDAKIGIPHSDKEPML